MSEKKSSSKFINWNVLFIIVIILFVLTFFLKSFFTYTKEISFNYFKNELLLQQKVERINILNKQKVYVFLKHSKTQKKISVDRYGLKRTNCKVKQSVACKIHLLSSRACCKL